MTRAGKLALLVFGILTAGVIVLALLLEGLEPQDRLMVIFTYVIAVATTAAVFQEPIRSWFWRPELFVSMTGEPPDCHKTQAHRSREQLTGPPLVLTIDCYYFRLRIRNDGRAAAHNVEVYLENVEVRRGRAWESYERFLPQWLPWVGIENMIGALPIYLPILPSHASRHADFAYVLNPMSGAQDEGELLSTVPRTTPLLILNVVPKYLRRGHLLPPDRYRFVVSVAAADHEPRKFAFEIDHRGWNDDETTMLKEGIIIHPFSLI